ncbi:hypothetical protein SAMN05414139_09153 [Burkholderia sp. D7]|jgi:hypothetical protein|nr:hypothetical protein SAMN05414139_09153 [Burkholderia sp. D7]
MREDVRSTTGGMVRRIGKQGSVMPGCPGVESRRKLSGKAGALAMLIAAMVLAIGVGGRMTNVEALAGYRGNEPSQHCAAQYAEMLDLAKLARRDGKSSDVMVRELTVMTGQMDECPLMAPVQVQASR